MLVFGCCVRAVGLGALIMKVYRFICLISLGVGVTVVYESS